MKEVDNQTVDYSKLHKKTKYYPNNPKALEEEYYVDDHNILQGKKIRFLPNGDKDYQTEYKDGVRNGKHIEYIENEKIYAEQYYKNNQLHGLTTIYLNDGKKETYVFLNGEKIENK